MSNRDKLIKLIATALALLLAFGIISGIVGIIMFFVQSSHGHIKSTSESLSLQENAETYHHDEYNGYDDEDYDDYDTDDYEDYDDDYDDDDTYNKDLKTVSYSNSFSNIKNIDIENPIYEIEIRQGDVDKVTVDCENVLEDYTVKVKNNTLVLSGNYDGHDWGKKGLSALLDILEGTSSSSDRKITVTLPKNTELNKCSIDSGTGSVEIEDINTENLDISNGTGSLNAKNISAASADIECGTGSVNLEDVHFKKTSLETGTGSTNISGRLEGKTEIESGMGSVDINLQGSKDDYNFDIEKGLGSLTVDNKSYKELQTNLPGISNFIDISGGMGSITIEFQYNS